MDEARGEEASERRSQQECILSGGVYLRHRLESELLKNIPAQLSPWRYYTSLLESMQLTAFRRAGVQEAVPLSDLKRTAPPDILDMIHVIHIIPDNCLSLEYTLKLEIVTKG